MHEEKKRVLVVDDHPLLREGIVQLLNRQRDLAVCAEAGDAAGAKQTLLDSSPDGVVLDLALGHGDGIELIKQLKALRPDVPILVVSMHEETTFAERALRAGAGGYVMKHQSPDEVLAALRTVLQGDIALSRKMNTLLVRRSLGIEADADDPVKAKLSDRELHVFQLIGTGLATRQIAAELGLSVKTIETYRENLKVKLGLKDGAALVSRAKRWVEER